MTNSWIKETLSSDLFTCFYRRASSIQRNVQKTKYYSRKLVMETPKCQLKLLKCH